jgi:hypothetical protein
MSAMQRVVIHNPAIRKIRGSGIIGGGEPPSFLLV